MLLAEGARWSSGGIQTGGIRGEIYSDGRYGISRRSRDAAGRGVPGVRAAKSSRFRKGE